MAWEDYIAVIESDLYEQGGLAKPILSRIAYLIVGPPEEGQDPDPNEGWCFATQDYFAANIGCSESEVQRVCLMFVEDGWLTTRIVRNRYGHPHKNYRWADGALARIQERKMKKDRQGRFLRTKNVNKVNKKSFTARSGEGSTLQQPYGDPNDALGTRHSRVALRQVAAEPHGTEPSSLTARRRKPHGTVPSVVGLRRFDEQVHELVTKQSHDSNASQTPSVRPLRGDQGASLLDLTQENLDPVEVSILVEGEIDFTPSPVNPQDTPTVPQTPSPDPRERVEIFECMTCGNEMEQPAEGRAPKCPCGKSRVRLVRAEWKAKSAAFGMED